MSENVVGRRVKVKTCVDCRVRLMLVKFWKARSMDGQNIGREKITVIAQSLQYHQQTRTRMGKSGDEDVPRVPDGSRTACFFLRWRQLIGQCGRKCQDRWALWGRRWRRR